MKLALTLIVFGCILVGIKCSGLQKVLLTAIQTPDDGKGNGKIFDNVKEALKQVLDIGKNDIELSLEEEAERNANLFLSINKVMMQVYEAAKNSKCNPGFSEGVKQSGIIQSLYVRYIGLALMNPLDYRAKYRTTLTANQKLFCICDMLDWAEGGKGTAAAFIRNDLKKNYAYTQPDAGLSSILD